MMYLSHLTIENFRCFGEGEDRFEISLGSGLTTLVGENDSGKTAVIDAVRFALGTSDQEWHRVEDADFFGEDTSRQIRIRCEFSGLSPADKQAFLEYLTYMAENPDEQVLHVNWTAKDTGERRRGRGFRRVEVCSGRDGDGPTFDQQARQLLTATYLRPLRDAEQALSAGRGSRLSQVLSNTPHVTGSGKAYQNSTLREALGQCGAPGEDGAGVASSTGLSLEELLELNVLGIADLANDLLCRQQGIADTRTQVDQQLSQLSLAGTDLRTSIEVSGSDAPDEVRLRQTLEKLGVSLGGPGRRGLGSNNLLFIACEYLLLAQDEAGCRLLLIEEPEAHLHPQSQLRVMRWLQDCIAKKGIQIIATTHSPNLASVVELDNMVLIQESRAFPLARDYTQLDETDYRFLERFLDVTKANLFFAKGVLIVEGDAENILLPTLAELIGRDLTAHGVSIVNVGGVGLRRYARIMQRADTDGSGALDVRVACITDMDVMPDCAPAICGLLKDDATLPAVNGRHWHVQGDFDAGQLLDRREDLEARASGQCVKTFVSDHWTLEYDLALGQEDGDGRYTGGLAEEVFRAACLAKADDAICRKTKTRKDVARAARDAYADLQFSPADGCATEEVRAATVHAEFVKKGVSKTVAAQYLAEILRARRDKGKLSEGELRRRLPAYLVDAIDYVTRGDGQPAHGGGDGDE